MLIAHTPKLVIIKNITDPAILDNPILIGLVFLRANLPMIEIHATDPYTHNNPGEKILKLS